MFKPSLAVALSLGFFLSACDQGAQTYPPTEAPADTMVAEPAAEEAMAPAAPPAAPVVADLTTYSCADLIPDVLAIAKQNSYNLVKIYNPVEDMKSRGEIRCTGSALLSSGGAEVPLYFRAYLDRDLDVIVEYNSFPFAP